MKKKIISFIFGFLMLMVGIFIDRNFLLKNTEIIISNEDISGQEDSFGSTVAIYVEQTEGEGDYIQKNNVPDDGSVYVVNSATHCIGGGI